MPAQATFHMDKDEPEAASVPKTCRKGGPAADRIFDIYHICSTLLLLWLAVSHVMWWSPSPPSRVKTNLKCAVPPVSPSLRANVSRRNPRCFSCSVMPPGDRGWKGERSGRKTEAASTAIVANQRFQHRLLLPSQKQRLLTATTPLSRCGCVNGYISPQRSHVIFATAVTTNQRCQRQRLYIITAVSVNVVQHWHP